MLPASSAAALHSVNFRPLLRGFILGLAAVGAFALVAASCSVLPAHAVGLALLGLLGLLLVLGLLGLRRENRLAQLPTAAVAPAARPQVLARREPVGEIRCNPFFELLSSSSL